MKSSHRILLHLAIGICMLKNHEALAGGREPIEFQGRVTAVNLAAKTISVRARTKEFVFQIDTQRCNITKDGNYPFQPGAQSPVLRSAQINDYVVGTLELDGPSPVVTRL